MKWLHTPSHIDIPGHTRVDHLADVGRRQSPLLFGQISIQPRRLEEAEADVSDEEWDEGCEGWEPEEELEESGPPPPLPCEEPLQGTPQRQVPGARGGGGLAGSLPHPCRISKSVRQCGFPSDKGCRHPSTLRRNRFSGGQGSWQRRCRRYALLRWNPEYIP